MNPTRLAIYRYLHSWVFVGLMMTFVYKYTPRGEGEGRYGVNPDTLHVCIHMISAICSDLLCFLEGSVTASQKVKSPQTAPICYFIEYNYRLGDFRYL